MQEKPIHIHTAKIDNNLNGVLLLIPPLIFAIILFSYFLSLRLRTIQIATTNSPAVLGDDKETKPTSFRNH